MKDTSRKLLYADDLEIVAEDKEELNESLEEWKEAFKQQVLRVNLEKTEVLSIGAHREELNIKLEGRTVVCLIPLYFVPLPLIFTHLHEWYLYKLIQTVVTQTVK